MPVRIRAAGSAALRHSADRARCGDENNRFQSSFSDTVMSVLHVGWKHDDVQQKSERVD